MDIPIVVLVMWAAVTITLLVQGGIRYAKQRSSKPNRT